MGKAITSAVQGIASLPMQNSLSYVHIVKRSLALASTLVLEQATNEETQKENWRLQNPRHCMSSNTLSYNYGDEVMHRIT